MPVRKPGAAEDRADVACAAAVVGAGRDGPMPRASGCGGKARRPRPALAENMPSSTLRLAGVALPIHSVMRSPRLLRRRAVMLLAIVCAGAPALPAHARKPGAAWQEPARPPAAASPAPPARPAAAAPAVLSSPVEIEVVDFPDVVDDARGGQAAAERQRPRLLPRRQRDATPVGRGVPMKVHLPTAGGPWPVVVVSHGAGGDRDTHFAQAQDLAAHGYVVVCVEHVGSNRDRLTQGLRPLQNLDAMIRDADEVLARPRDVAFAIDQAERWNRTHPRLRGRCDLERVGAMGHSFGAFTTMVVCGMRPALDWLAPPVPPGKGLGPDLRDARVRCGVALSPQGVGEPFFVAESFGSLQAPLLGVSGDDDHQQAGQPARNRRAAFARWPDGDHRFVWLANASHLDFTDSTGASRRMQPSPTRAAVQPITKRATLAFFDWQLKGDAGSGATLSEAGLRPLLHGAVDAVEVLAK